MLDRQELLLCPFFLDEVSDGLEELSYLPGNVWPSLVGGKLMAESV